MAGRPEPLIKAESGPILVERLRARRVEMEQVALARIWSISTEAQSDDGVYPYGLQRLVRSALLYGYQAIESPVDEIEPAPVQLLRGARKAARRNIPLEVILRGYLAGQTLLADFIADEAGRDQAVGGPELHKVMCSLPVHASRLIDEVTREYTQEQRRSAMSTRGRQALEIVRVLSGASLDTASFNYDFDLVHTGAVAVGPEAAEYLRGAAAASGYRLLLVDSEDGSVWAWLGSQRVPRADELEDLLSSAVPPQVRLALGESSAGISGWRLTHHQAKSALPFALRNPKGITRYADVALPATMLRDRILFSSVQQRYLAALAGDPDGGTSLRETLRAYWGANRNVSSAAAALGVNRHTVARRIRALEERFGCPLHRCEGEVMAALQLEELDVDMLEMTGMG